MKILYHTISTGSNGMTFVSMYVTLSSFPNILNRLSIFLTAISFQTLETFITLISTTIVFRPSSQANQKNTKVDGIRIENMGILV